ncbi:VirB3 family type IV secretion system protein [Pseudomonas corrugata]|uniref:VirB3 family type IV secretion system protein n=1 Tax=Pseudomonas corrugata TaxID=47879 RepID=UPI0018E60CEA|nr:VirB3 family type IV secretion system protein [Pseudomonas corrugata]MBI6694201.1 VirB3 family type IV secretion system protein [Pseudomonas corrugata]
MSNGAEEEDEYVTFKGLGTISMFMGVPLLPALALASIGLITGFAGCMLFGPIGLVCPALCGLAIFALKIMCEADNKALEVAKWKLKGWHLRFVKVTTTLTVSPSAVGKKNEHILRYFKKIYRSK